MTDRIVEIAETSARLNLENHLLKIQVPDQEPVTVPIADLQCLILANPAVTLSGAVLSELASVGCMVVVSGPRRLPTGMLLPLEANYLQSERFLAQISAGKPLCKRLWQKVIQAKIRNQATILQEFAGSDCALKNLIPQIGSGDPDNVEGRAAVIYWKNLFPDIFLRDRDVADNNLLLNYGYAVLRAVTARACCAAGLHPTIGIHHHNRYDAYCLADDLMEPFRVLIDRTVRQLNPENEPVSELSREYRAALLGSLLVKLKTSSGMRSVTEILQISARQLAQSFVSQEVCLELDFCP